MVLGLSNIDQTNNRKSCQIITNKSIQAILARKSIDHEKAFLNSKNIFTAEDNRLVTVPIKEYSNKFLREKRREEVEGGVRKKEPFPNSHLHNNRKLISEFKKYKGRNQKFRKSVNKENGDFIIYNLLFQKQDPTCPNHTKPHKTIFGTFTQNPQPLSTHNTRPQQSTLFQKHFTATSTQNIFLARKQVYEKICQKQKSLIPEYRKKCKTFGDVANVQEKRMEKISTSRALEKYSKIVKVNPEHGKIEKMRIKKELAKSLRLEGGENNQIQTKRIVLGQKHNGATKRKGSFLAKDMPQRPASIDHLDRQNQSIMQMARTPQKSVQNFITSKVGLFTSAGRFRKVRKFSQQVESNKKCMTEESKLREDETFGDFQINGWDINF